MSILINDAIDSSELIVTKDGRIYHLDLLPDDIADTILLVGDPARVDLVASYWDSIELTRSHREFRTITGYYRGLRLSVISTGIGTDNIDIVLNELDALVNIDLKTRQRHTKPRYLRLLRLGTCGALNPIAKVDSLIFSDWALGLDNLLYYYQDYPQILNQELNNKLLKALNWQISEIVPYLVASSQALKSKFNKPEFLHGITLTAPGFYAPQLRELRLKSSLKFLQDIQFSHKLPDLPPILNFEMETSGLYALATLLGHEVATLCVVVANRYAGTFSKNAESGIRNLIEKSLAILIDSE